MCVANGVRCGKDLVMTDEFVLFAIFVVFTGAAIVGGIALYARQSLLVAYIVLGGLLGPFGFALVENTDVIKGIGHVGIVFLLFLLGLNLHPQKLLRMLQEAVVVTLGSSALFLLSGGVIAWLFGYGVLESVLIGCMMIFSSTILGLKLLPTTALHHRRMGEVIISVLLLQDILAIVILVSLQSGVGAGAWLQTAQVVLALPVLALVAFGLERLVLDRIITRFDTILEYVFLVAIGWCVGFAQLAHLAGLSFEMGAFIAGVALATSRISTFIAESLKPLRDFFLIMFFFSLGASFDLHALPSVALPALVLAVVMLALKPWWFQRLLTREAESEKLSREIGFRLGQNSEFSLLIAVLALETGVLSSSASYLVQTTTLITFVVSSYLIMLRFPTPIAIDAKLRRD